LWIETKKLNCNILATLPESFYQIKRDKRFLQFLTGMNQTKEFKKNLQIITEFGNFILNYENSRNR
jgi:hypothetical protein